MKEKGYAYGTIKNYRRSLLACFYTAVREDYVRKNPFSFDFGKVIENTTIKKTGIDNRTGRKSACIYQRGYGI